MWENFFFPYRNKFWFFFLFLRVSTFFLLKFFFIEWVKCFREEMLDLLEGIVGWEKKIISDGKEEKKKKDRKLFSSCCSVVSKKFFKYFWDYLNCFPIIFKRLFRERLSGDDFLMILICWIYFYLLSDILSIVL